MANSKQKDTQQARRDADSPAPARNPGRRAGDHVEAYQRALADPTTWPYPPPRGKTGLTWAVLANGQRVKWTTLGLDRRLDERLKFWAKVGQTPK
jgi:hypothetical protein